MSDLENKLIEANDELLEDKVVVGTELKADPISEPIHETMELAAALLVKLLPNLAFTLIVFNNDDIPRVNYIANADRGEVVTALEGLIRNMKAGRIRVIKEHDDEQEAAGADQSQV